jgi:hypothetical protein
MEASMKKLVVLAMLGVLGLAATAQAEPDYVPAPPPPPPPKPHQHSPSPHYTPSKPHHAPPTHSHRCVPHNVGYRAGGTLVSAALTPAGHHRYSGPLVVDLTRANHRAPVGEMSLALTMVRVGFHHGVDPASPAAGSRVKLHGKITALRRRCPSAGFTPTVTVRKVDIWTPRHHHGSAGASRPHRG